MPWSQTSPLDQSTQFIADYLRDRLSVTACFMASAQDRLQVGRSISPVRPTSS